MDIRFVYFLTVISLVQCKLVNLRCDGIKQFVDGHNSRRLQLAEGKVPGQPAASEMNALIWDDELAAKAAKWASKNRYGHNPDNTIRSGRFNVGENIYEYRTTAKNHNFDLNNAISAWFDEYKDFTYKEMEWSDFSDSSPVVGHYTQMAWSDTTHIGCAISNYYRDGWYCFYVVCNYGPAGNYMGQTPYKRGAASGAITCDRKDCDRMYGKYC